MTNPIKITFVEKKKDYVDISILYSFDGPFQLLHADVGNLEFLGKSATDPKYCLLFVDLFTSKVYVYPMKSRKSILNKMEIFYKEVEGKRKGQKTRLQTDQEFKQNKIFDWIKNTMLRCFQQLLGVGKHLQPKTKIKRIEKKDL